MHCLVLIATLLLIVAYTLFYSFGISPFRVTEYRIKTSLYFSFVFSVSVGWACFGVEVNVSLLFIAFLIMLLISLTDLCFYLIPSGLVYGLGICFLVTHQGCPVSSILQTPVLLFMIFYVLYSLPSKHGRPMLGYGDVKLAPVLGLIFSARCIPAFLFLSATLCLAGLLLRSLIEGRLVKQSPFGPWMCFSALLIFINQTGGEGY